MSGHFYLERDFKILKLDIFKNVQNDLWRFWFEKNVKPRQKQFSTTNNKINALESQSKYQLRFIICFF
jgi:hypothetical protein